MAIDKIRFRVPIHQSDLKKLGYSGEAKNKFVSQYVRERLHLPKVERVRSGVTSDAVQALRAKGITVPDKISKTQLIRLLSEKIK